MKNTSQNVEAKISLAILIFVILLTGCGKSPDNIQETSLPTENSQTVPTQDIKTPPPPSYNQIIAEYREKLGLLQLPLTGLGTDLMGNAPSGSVSVEVYADSEGRLYKVEIATNRVIEIDARSLLNTTPDLPTLPVEELRALALQYANMLIPNFEERQASLSYQEGGKDPVYFFDWTEPGQMNPARLQIGLDQYGRLFALIDTLPIDD